MSVVQAVGNDNGAGATTLVFTIASSASGNLVGVAAQCQNAPTITDNLGQTGYIACANNGAWGGYIFYKPNSAAGVTTITLTSTSGWMTGFAYELDSIPTTATEDATATSAVGPLTTWTSGASGSTTQNDTVGICLTSNTSTTGLNYAVDSPGVAASGTGITAGTHVNAGFGGESFLSFTTYTTVGAKTVTGTCNSATSRTTLSIVKASAAAAASYPIESTLYF